MTNSSAKSRSLVASMLFAVAAVESEAVRHQSPIQRQRRPRHRARSQRANVQPLPAVRQPIRIAQKHFDIRQQPMSHQHRFRPLQMRVRRHGSIRSLFRAIHQHAAQFGKFLPQLIDRRPHVQPQVGRNLLIAAAAAVQLVSRSPISATSCFSTK